MYHITWAPIIPIITFISQTDEMCKSVDLWLCEGDCLSFTPRLPVMILLLCAWITGRGADIKTCTDMKLGIYSLPDSWLLSFCVAHMLLLYSSCLFPNGNHDLLFHRKFLTVVLDGLISVVFLKGLDINFSFLLGSCCINDLCSRNCAMYQQ